jgi:thiol-disulfide isomerase/thioredoxin
MNRKNFIALILIVVVVLLVALLTYFIRSNARDRSQNEAINTLFSEEEAAVYLDAQSNPISLSNFEDKIIVVNVWASWSPFTEIEFPILNELAATYKDRGVNFLVMNRKESQTQIERYLATLPPYENLTQVIDVNDFFYAGVDGYAMPETIIYDSKGKIIQHIRGVVVKSELEATLNTILEAEN